MQKAIKTATENADHSGYDRPIWVDSGLQARLADLPNPKCPLPAKSRLAQYRLQATTTPLLTRGVLQARDIASR